MKTRTALVVALVFIFILKGCIPSLHPLYRDSDRIIVDAVKGSWQEMGNPDEKYVFTIDPEDPLSYVLFFTEDEDNNKDTSLLGFATAAISVNLIELEDHLFADFFPGENEVFDKLNGMLRYHLLGVHTFARLEIKPDTLIINRFDPGWLETIIEENRIRIAHEVLDDQIILTATTEELQDFVVKYAGDPDAYIDPLVLVRPAI